MPPCFGAFEELEFIAISLWRRGHALIVPGGDTFEAPNERGLMVSESGATLTFLAMRLLREVG
uniref:Uncharacterized protein n=1 Tax=Muribaculaceae bacterium Z82 TaxID=2304548 RepID=A0A7C9JNL0_9BACT